MIIPHTFRAIKFSLIDLAEQQPIRFLHTIRFLPLIVGFAIIATGVVIIDLNSPMRTMGGTAFIAAGIWLVTVGIGLFALAVAPLHTFLPLSVRFGFHLMLLFGILLLVTWWYATWTVELTKVLILTTFVWLGTVRIVDYLIEALIWQRRHRVRRIDLGQDRLSLNEEDYWIICVHEAGHLLLYGMLSRLPEDAFAAVDRSPRYAMAGFVSLFDAYKFSEMTAKMLEWNIEVAFAGAAAEELVFGSHGEGVTMDFQNGDAVIRRLAAIDPSLTYFSKPENETEERVNAETIVAIRSRCLAASKEYLQLNYDKLLDVAKFLRDKESMDCAEFAPIWQQLRLPLGRVMFDPPARIPCLPTVRSFSSGLDQV